MNGEAVTALIVDDQELVRSGLSLILRAKHGIVVVGECSDGDEVLDAVAPAPNPMLWSWTCE